MGICCGRTCNNLLHEHGTFRCGTCQESKQVCKTCSHKYVRCCNGKYNIRQTSLCNDESHERFELQCPKCKVAIIYRHTCKFPSMFDCCGKKHNCRSRVYDQTKEGRKEYQRQIERNFCSLCGRYGCKEYRCPSKQKIQMCEWLDGCTNVAYKGYKICSSHNDCFKCGKNKYDKNLNTSTGQQIRGNFCSTCNHFHGDRCTHPIPI